VTAAPANASFTSGKETLVVQFNPASLRVSLSNQFGKDPPDQHAKPTSTKLDVELTFDTTETGADVRKDTAKLRKMATATAKEPKGKGGKKKDEADHSLAKIMFCWGTAKYFGVIESFTETLDYWSSDGVPLRATIQLSMKGAADKFFEGDFKGAEYSSTNPMPEVVDFIPVDALPAGTGATGAAAKAGDPRAGRSLAAANGLENMRAPTGASMGASASANLAAAASFKMSGGISAGASAGFGAGASAGGSASAGLSASVGVGMAGGASAGFGASAGAAAGFGASAGAGAGFGASAGAGFGATAGASAGAGFGATAGASAGAGFGASAGASATASFGARASAGAFASASASGGAFGSAFSSASSGSAGAAFGSSQAAFAALGASKTTLPSGSFNPNLLLGPPAPSVGPTAQFESTGKLVTGGGQVAATYSAQASVKFF
jgi:hypothetical protein